jgi:hypothetical protein
MYAQPGYVREKSQQKNVKIVLDAYMETPHLSRLRSLFAYSQGMTDVTSRPKLNFN